MPEGSAAVQLTSHVGRLGLSILVAGMFVTNAFAQEIRIKVLNGRNGHPVANECVNVWIGPVRGPALLLATDGDGVASLRLATNASEENPGHRTPACGGTAVVDPVVAREDTINVTSATGMLCQAHPPDSPALSFSVPRVLDSGDSTANVCGKAEASPEPGELIFFERPRSFLERLRQ